MHEKYGDIESGGFQLMPAKPKDQRREFSTLPYNFGERRLEEKRKALAKKKADIIRGQNNRIDEGLFGRPIVI